MSITKITVTNDDGTTQDFSPSVAPVAAPSVVEVQVVLSNDQVENFVPAPTVPTNGTQLG